MVTETKIVITYVDTRGRLRTRISTLSMDDVKRVLDLVDEVGE